MKITWKTARFRWLEVRRMTYIFFFYLTLENPQCFSCLIFLIVFYTISGSRNDQSKRKLVKEFIVCNQSNSEVIDKCDEKLLEVTCTKVFARTCVYKAICTRKDKKCNGTHENNSLHCCTFYCNSPVKIQSKMNPLTLFLPGRYSLGTPLYIIIYHFLNLFSCVLKFFDF